LLFPVFAHALSIEFASNAAGIELDANIIGRRPGAVTIDAGGAPETISILGRLITVDAQIVRTEENAHVVDLTLNVLGQSQPLADDVSVPFGAFDLSYERRNRIPSLGDNDVEQVALFDDAQFDIKTQVSPEFFDELISNLFGDLDDSDPLLELTDGPWQWTGTLQDPRDEQTVAQVDFGVGDPVDFVVAIEVDLAPDLDAELPPETPQSLRRILTRIGNRVSLIEQISVTDLRAIADDPERFLSDGESLPLRDVLNAPVPIINGSYHIGFTPPML
jgi:hypothetical protein